MESRIDAMSMGQEAQTVQTETLPQAQHPESSAPPQGMREVLESLKARYGVQGDDWQAIHDRMQQQDKHQAQVRSLQAWSRAQEKLTELRGQEEALRQLYPGFSLKEEGKRLLPLLREGCSLQEAYEALHPGELQTRLLRKVEADYRPQEAASRSRVPVKTRTALSQLSRAQREEVARRVLRGEKIQG